MSAPAPKVTVLVVTYNHARFVTQALESVLGQRTNFAVEILVSEDCSTDGTREKVIAYQRKYPERIRLLLSEKNVRSNAVVARGIRAARGGYIAMLDGDDYWISADKLQKQADFLDRQPRCSCCFHNARVEEDGGSKASWNWTPVGHPPISTLKEIWQGNFIATCSIMYRRSALAAIPAWYDDLFPMTDWPLHILSAERGDIGYLDEVLGVYRYHPGGLYSQFDQWEKLEKTRNFYLTMNSNLDYRYDKLVRSSLSKYFFEWAEEYAKRRERARAWHCFRRYLGGRPFNEHISVMCVLSLVARLLLPGSLNFR
jgi:glycosyltransferase involved in cell wall biosynthesis